jgi:hypothetical protein
MGGCGRRDGWVAGVKYGWIGGRRDGWVAGVRYGWIGGRREKVRGEYRLALL